MPKNDEYGLPEGGVEVLRINITAQLVRFNETFCYWVWMKQNKMKKSKLKTLESNLTYIRSTYQRMILDKAKLGKPVDRMVERLKAVEIQLWMVKESGKKKKVSNG